MLLVVTVVNPDVLLEDVLLTVDNVELLEVATELEVVEYVELIDTVELDETDAVELLVLIT